MTDEELINEIKSGSQAAIEILIRRYYNEVYGFIYRRTQQQSLSYDLTQEVFVKMFKSISSFQGKSKFRSWLITIALNQVRDYMRTKKKDFINIENEWLERTLTDTKNNVSYLFEKKEEAQEIRNALAQLPDFQSEAIILKYFHGYKYREIAEMTNSTESAVKSRIFQGLKKLSKILRREVNERRSKSGRI